MVSRVANIENVLEWAEIGGEKLQIPECIREINEIPFCGFREIKSLRNLVVHACGFDQSDALGETRGRKGGVVEINLSADALEALSQRIELVWRELREISDIYRMYAQAHRDRQTRTRELETLKLNAQVADVKKRLLAWQKCRRSLPALPEIPETRATMPPHVTRRTSNAGVGT